MARIFIILFEHEGTTCNAMINVQQSGRQTEYVVNMLDENLQQQLRSNRLIADKWGQLNFVAGKQQVQTPLMHSLKKAVVMHLVQVRGC